MFGLLNAIFMIWYTNGYDYPLVIGGKPLFAWEFSIPVMFELTILLSAFAAVFGMFALNGLPKFYHPIFEYAKARERATDDRYMLVIEASDPKFDIEQTPRILSELGALRTEVIDANEAAAIHRLCTVLLTGCAAQASRNTPVDDYS